MEDFTRQEQKELMENLTKLEEAVRKGKWGVEVKEGLRKLREKIFELKRAQK